MRYDTLTVGIMPPRLHIVVDVVLPANDACSTNVAGRYVGVAKEGHGVVVVIREFESMSLSL
jgi:hypothetical protein